MEPTLAGLNAFVRAWDAYGQARERLFGFGLANTVHVPSMGWLQRAANAAGRSMHRMMTPSGAVRWSVNYRGIDFVYQSGADAEPCAYKEAIACN